MMKLNSILVALDSSGSMPLLKAAAELAKKANAELRAIYIEDTQWFEISKFSFTQQVSSFTGEVLPFDENRVIRESRALSSLLEKRFKYLGNSMQIRYSYQSVRGSIDRELMNAASEVDLVMIGKTGHTSGPRKSIGSNALYLAEHCRVPVLVWNNGSKWPDQIIGICHQPEESNHTIHWSVRLADQLNKQVRLFWPEQVDLQGNWAEEMKDMRGPWPDIISRLEYISEVHPNLNIDLLRYYRNSIFIIRRNTLSVSDRSLLENLSNSLILL